MNEDARWFDVCPADSSIKLEPTDDECIYRAEVGVLRRIHSARDRPWPSDAHGVFGIVVRRKDEKLTDHQMSMMTTELMEVFVANEKRESGSTASPSVHTTQELRDLMEAFYDREYDAEDRHMPPKPTVAEVEQCLDDLLSKKDDLVIERHDDGRFSMLQDDILEERIGQFIMKTLRGEE